MQRNAIFWSKSTTRTALVAGIALGAACLAARATPAEAMPIGSTTNVDFTGGATAFGYDGGSFTLSDNGAPAFDPSPVSVATSANAGVSSIFGQPSVYFDPLRGPVVFDNSVTYASYASATAIPYSATASFLGLEVTGADGTHFGYAEFAGTDLISYAFESDPGVGIVPGSLTAVPEPVSLSLLATGLVGLGFVRRRRIARNA